MHKNKRGRLINQLVYLRVYIFRVKTLNRCPALVELLSSHFKSTSLWSDIPSLTDVVQPSNCLVMNKISSSSYNGLVIRVAPFTDWRRHRLNAVSMNTSDSYVPLQATPYSEQLKLGALKSPPINILHRLLALTSKYSRIFSRSSGDEPGFLYTVSSISHVQIKINLHQTRSKLLIGLVE